MKGRKKQAKAKKMSMTNVDASTEKPKRRSAWETRRAIQIAKVAPNAQARYGELYRELKDTPAGKAFATYGAKMMINLNFNDEVASENMQKLKKLIDYPPVGTGTITVKLSPPMAWAALMHSRKNRHMRRNTVGEYAEVMKESRWKYNGQPIIFSKSGLLLTGQHRLAAVIVSGATIMTDLKFGIDDDAAPTIDVGKSWSAADTLSRDAKIDVGGYYATFAAALAWIDRYNNGLPGHFHARLLNTRAVELAAQYPDMIRSVKVATRIVEKFRPAISASNMAFCHWLMHRKNAQQASVFFGRLEEGVGFTGKHDPIYMMREHLMRVAAELRMPSRMSNIAKKSGGVVMMALMIKAWNAFRRNEPIQKLIWKGFGEEKVEAFPKAE